MVEEALTIIFYKRIGISKIQTEPENRLSNLCLLNLAQTWLHQSSSIALDQDFLEVISARFLEKILNNIYSKIGIKIIFSKKQAILMRDSAISGRFGNI